LQWHADMTGIGSDQHRVGVTPCCGWLAFHLGRRWRAAGARRRRNTSV